VVICLLFAARR